MIPFGGDDVPVGDAMREDAIHRSGLLVALTQNVGTDVLGAVFARIANHEKAGMLSLMVRIRISGRTFSITNANFHFALQWLAQSGVATPEYVRNELWKARVLWRAVAVSASIVRRTLEDVFFVFGAVAAEYFIEASVALCDAPSAGAIAGAKDMLLELSRQVRA